MWSNDSVVATTSAPLKIVNCSSFGAFDDTNAANLRVSRGYTRGILWQYTKHIEKTARLPALCVHARESTRTTLADGAGWTYLRRAEEQSQTLSSMTLSIFLFKREEIRFVYMLSYLKSSVRLTVAFRADLIFWIFSRGLTNCMRGVGQKNW